MNARGMTLVELLVVLVILAGLTAAVMTGAAATREKGRYEQTARDAEAMAEALTRADGLSLVSDLGLVPDSAEALCLLFGARLPTETVTPDPENPGETVASVAVLDVPAWALRSAPLIPATTAPQYTAAEVAAVAAITNRFAAVTLGAGWRGPYCAGDALAADDSDPDNPIPYVVDGFGGPWEFDGETLVSRGRDRMDDALRPDAAAVDWRDRDRTFAVSAPAPTLSLTVEAEGAAVVQRLHVFVHQPALTLPMTVGAEPTVGLSCRYYRFDENADSVLLSEGLTLGERVVFVLAETASGAMAAPPRRVLLRPGTNAVTLPLHSASAYPLTSP